MSRPQRPGRPPRPRPSFPKRAVITGGMPYGNKSLHFGHIGGVFVHADVLARFLKDRIGPDNVIFVSGTDCYGSPIVVKHRQMVEEEGFEGSLEDLVRHHHELQKATLAAYQVAPSLFAASALGRAGELHKDMSRWIFDTLLANGHLELLSTEQFYDPERETFLNGRQVRGRCPIQGCQSENAYADECSLGHQYLARDLIDPVSTLTGQRPVLRKVSNWYIKLPDFRAELERWVEQVAADRSSRKYTLATLREFFGEPDLHVVKRQIEQLEGLRHTLPEHTEVESAGSSMSLRFASLDDRERACELLSDAGIQFRNGKTLVPFRLSSSEPWGVPVPDTEQTDGLSFWVWPESLWAPISFTRAVLEARGESPDSWRDWWCSKDARVYQIIGEDNVYFYGPAEMAMFMGTQGEAFTADAPDGQLQLPDLVVNRHLLFLGRKASSSSAIKPPMAGELLDHYTPDQLRAHFISLGLADKNGSFRPKPLNPDAPEKEGDPVLKEGKVLTGLLNRLARSCFYGCQDHTDGRVPNLPVSAKVLQSAERSLLDYERLMADKRFPQAFGVAEKFIRQANKTWAAGSKAARADESLWPQALADSFHNLRVAASLMHPIVPFGCEKIREQLNLDERLWSWEHIFEPLTFFMDDPDTHALKALAAREDFFAPHPSQFRS